MFQAILAWPIALEAASFHRVSEELMAGTLRHTRRQAPDLIAPIKAEWPHMNWPAIEARARKRSPALGSLKKRLNQRMAAARAGIGKTHEQIFGIPAILPPGMTALSIDQLCGLIKNDVSIDDPENVEKLVWRKSLPILHVAMAVQLLLTAYHPDRKTVGADLQDIDFYREAVRVAGLLEPLVHDHAEIAITRDQMTLLRWFE